MSILKAIGNTPIIDLDFKGKTSAHISAKLEYLNPGGSIKDRSALYLIEKAERDGALKKGGVIIEASSGNQGIAVAMIGRAKEYEVIIVVPERISIDKRRAIQAYGAKVIVAHASESIKDPKNNRNYARELFEKTPNAFMPNQYFNTENPESYYYTLGPEIWKQTDGKITHFLTAAGTGGTISGVGRFLKEQNPDIQVIGVDVDHSFRSTGGFAKPYILEGIGVDFETPCLDMRYIDAFIPISDEDGLAFMKKTARDHGILVGTASGAVMAALQKILPTLKSTDHLVTIFTDSGRAYLSAKYWNEEWV